MCGQSGSGKTYSLGLVLEQLLMETNLRLIILTPTPITCASARCAAKPNRVVAEPYRKAAGGVAVYSADAPRERTLRLQAADDRPGRPGRRDRSGPDQGPRGVAAHAEILAAGGSSVETLAAATTPRCAG